MFLTHECSYDIQELVLKAEVESQRKEKEKFQAGNVPCEQIVIARAQSESQP